MTLQEPTLQYRELGRRLRDAVTSAGLDGIQLARRMNKAQSTISRWFSGQRHLVDLDAAAVLGICGVPREQWEPVLRLARPMLDPVMVTVPGPARFGAYRDLVDGAVRVVEYGAVELPWPVRTRDYARALERPATVPHSALVALAAQAHTARSAVVSSSTVVSVVVHEWALRTPVGGPAVMAGQLAYLERLARTTGYHVRVVPAEAGGVGAVGSFGLLGWHEEQFRPAVVRFEPGALVGCDDPDMVGAYRTRLVELQWVAWDGPTSHEFIRQMAKEMTALAAEVGAPTSMGVGGVDA